MPVNSEDLLHCDGDTTSVDAGTDKFSLAKSIGGYLSLAEDRALGDTTARLILSSCGQPIPENDLRIPDAASTLLHHATVSRVTDLVSLIDAEFTTEGRRSVPLIEPDRLLFLEDVKALFSDKAEVCADDRLETPGLLLRYLILADNFALDILHILSCSYAVLSEPNIRLLEQSPGDEIRYHESIRATMIILVNDFLDSTEEKLQKQVVKMIDALVEGELKRNLYKTLISIAKPHLRGSSRRFGSLKEGIQQDTKALDPIEIIEPETNPGFDSLSFLRLRDRLIASLASFDLNNQTEFRQLVCLVLRYFSGLTSRTVSGDATLPEQPAGRTRTVRDSGLQQLFAIFKGTEIDRCGGTRDGVSSWLKNTLEKPETRQYLGKLLERLEYIQARQVEILSFFDGHPGSPLSVVYQRLVPIITHFLNDKTFEQFDTYDHYRETLSHSNAPMLEKQATKKWYDRAFPGGMSGSELRLLLQYHHLFPKALTDDQIQIMFNSVSSEVKIKLLLQERRKINDSLSALEAV